MELAFCSPPSDDSTDTPSLKREGHLFCGFFEYHSRPPLLYLGSSSGIGSRQSANNRVKGESEVGEREGGLKVNLPRSSV